MVQEVLIYLSLIITLAAAMAVLARMIGQPPIIAYMFAGVLAGPLFFNFINSMFGCQLVAGYDKY